ncbi:MAG: transaldolase [Flavitalea sp.]
MNTKVEALHNMGQSIWLDFIDRKIMDSGELERLITEEGIRGITSNPSIFQQAISSGNDYDDDIIAASQVLGTNDEIYYSLAVSDIRRAADLLHHVYNGKTRGADGYVSLEVSPHYAYNTFETIFQAKDLWELVCRENLMIKIPATTEGLPAIRECIRLGLNVNVTLIFSLTRYREVVNAYLSGLQDRLNDGNEIAHIASVASFFLSRIDINIGPLLERKDLGALNGHVAIAMARKAYAIYEECFLGKKFEQLREHGALPQRLLWASTAARDPKMTDTFYIETLIFPETINTLNLSTLNAFFDRGIVDGSMLIGLKAADEILMLLEENDIDLEALATRLEDKGVVLFITAYEEILATIEEQKTIVRI